MADARIELPLLAARLKAAGAVGVRREMVRGLRQAGQPFVGKLQDEARSVLPKGGGLNEFVAKQKPKVSVRTTGRTAGVRIRSKVRGNYTNTGTWRHPVFGNRKVWRPQTYEPGAGWWERVEAESTPEAIAAMDTVLVAVAAQVRGLGI